MGEGREPRSITYRAGVRDAGRRLDLFLKERIPRMSRERLKEAIRTRVAVRGRSSVRPATELSPGDEVIVSLPETDSVGAGSLPAPRVPVLHLDADVIAVDKPAGLLVHGTTSSKGPSLLGILSGMVPGELHLVHRLDRETSGVVVLARSPGSARELSRFFAKGEARKSYLAVVFGRVPAEEGLIDLPLGRAPASAVHIKQGVDRESGRPARTRYRVVERLAGFTLLEAVPATGRRHQIRVHLQALGHPVVGDKLYGASESHHIRYLARGFDDRMRRELLAERQLLHASRLELPHPGGRSGRLVLESPLPEDMAAFLESRRVRH